jgi:predicted permease
VSRIRRLFRFPTLTRDRARREVDEELEFHLTIVAAHLVANGWSPADAAVEARRRFGDLEYTRQYCYREDTLRAGEVLRMTFIDELGQDLRYAARALRRAPGFATIALLTLALGIGANTAVFSVVRGVLLTELPFGATDRTVRIWHANHQTSTERGAVSEPDFLDWRAQSRVAESMGGFFFAEGLSGVDLTGDGNPERLSAALVTDGFFETLQARPLIGRALTRDDQLEGKNRVVVLGYGLWTRRFNNDPAILGRTVQLNGDPFTVVGVMAPSFTYPANNALDAWIPLSYFGPESIGRARGARFLSVIARTKPDASADQLHAELRTISQRLAATYNEDRGWDDATIMPIRDSIVGEVRRPLIILLGAVSLLLLITCVNIASLLLARASARQGELTVRAALGAGRSRIVRQMLTESILLSTLGGGLGIGLAYGALRALRASGIEIPGIASVRIDVVMLVFALVVAVGSGLLFGLLPALRAAGSSLQQSLRADSRGMVGGRGQKLRSALVLAEVALAVMLVIGAGLATKSFAKLIAVDPGYRAENTLVAMMSIGGSHQETEDRFSYYYRVLDAIAAVPGVRSVGSVRDLPTVGTGEKNPVVGGGSPLREDQRPLAQYHQVSTDYFKTLGVPLKEGRFFERTDRAGKPFVVIINEELGHRLWPGEKQFVGKSLMFGTSAIPIVGVVGNIRQAGIALPPEPAVYIHVLHSFRSRMSIVIRTQGDPLAVAGAVRRAIWSVDQSQTITRVAALEDIVGRSVARERALAWLLGLFGTIGLVLGALGIYGVLAFAVTQRQKEIGVRVALGASPGSVMRAIVGQGVGLATAGVAIGLVGARLLAHTMQGVLFAIQATDPATFAQVVAVLLGAALLASWLPARRALRVDPISALRAD